MAKRKSNSIQYNKRQKEYEFYTNFGTVKFKKEIINKTIMKQQRKLQKIDFKIYKCS